MIGVFGGTDVRVADYATFGTAELSRNALVALDGRTACLLANHGQIALGRDLEQALWRAVELEVLARQYILALQAGGPVLLTEAEIAAARAKFGGYGRL
jgi:L-fuculose-phosphate aldolase